MQDENYYRNILEELDDRDGLTESEIDFLYSIFEDHTRPLTSTQKETIDRMKERYLA